MAAADAVLKDRAKMVTLAERMALRAAQNTDISNAYSTAGGAGVTDSLVDFIVQFLWDGYAPSVLSL
jgi:hypothetical protein